MKVLVNNRVYTLELLDSNGIDSIADFIAMHASDDFRFDPEDQIYICVSEEAFNWWQDVVTAHPAVNNRITHLMEIYGTERIDALLLEVFAEYGNSEIDVLPDLIDYALDRFCTNMSVTEH